MKTAKILAIPRLRSGWRGCRAILVVALGLMVWPVGVAEAEQMGTAWTYQGRLMDVNQPTDGLYDFQFKVFDANVGGSQVGGDVNKPDVDVIDGYFTVELDFGSSVFAGDARWLEIGVRPGDSSGSFNKLSPRQEVTPTPYAFRSEYAKSVEQLICNFVVDADDAVAAGDVVSLINGNVVRGYNGSSVGKECTFNAASTGDISAVGLSDTKFVVAYRDLDNSGYGTAVVGEVSGKMINFNRVEYVFNAASTRYISVTALSTSRFVVAYQDAGNSSYGTTVLGHVGRDKEGYSISFGEPNVFKDWGTDDISATALSDTKFVVAYHVHGYCSAAVVGKTIGNGCEFDEESVFNDDPPTLETEISAAALSDSKFVVAYMDVGNHDYGTAVIGDIGVPNIFGRNIIYGSEYVFNPAETHSISVAALSSTKFVVAYQDYHTRSGTAIVGETTGNAIVFGSEYLFRIANPLKTELNSVAALSDSKFVVGFVNKEDGPFYGTAAVGDVSGNSIAFARPYVFNEASSPRESISAAALSESKFVVAYSDYGNSGYGTGIVGDISVPIGIADSTAGGGESVPVIIHGIAGHQSSLIPGQSYYANPDGSLTLTRLSTKVGVAVSPTELLLDIE